MNEELYDIQNYIYKFPSFGYDNTFVHCYHTFLIKNIRNLCDTNILIYCVRQIKTKYLKIFSKYQNKEC